MPHLRMHLRHASVPTVSERSQLISDEHPGLQPLGHPTGGRGMRYKKGIGPWPRAKALEGLGLVPLDGIPTYRAQHDGGRFPPSVAS